MDTSAMKLMFFSFILSLWTTPSLSSNILLVSTNSFASPSHYMVLSTVTGGLVSKGHNVTLVSNDQKKTTGFPNGTFSQVLFAKASYTSDEDTYGEASKEAQTMAFSSMGVLEMMRQLTDVFERTYRNCRDLWEDPRVLDQLKQDSDFDLVLVFPFSSCDVLMAHYLEVPFVVVFPAIRAPTFHEGFIGMPYPSSYVPFNMLGSLSDEMTFFERLGNLLFPLVFECIGYYTNSYYYGIQKEFNIHPDKYIKELYGKASLLLAHVSLSSDFPRPYTPNFVPIGGLISHPIKPLAKELEEFVEGSGEHGVIIFTLGSLIKGLEDNGMAETFAKAFSRFPQRVLWRHNGEPPSNLGNNTKLVKWLPQNDLLGHPKTRLLIYHGGGNGVCEGIYHGVPVVIIPLFGDQPANAVRVEKKGMGLVLEKTNITEESLTAVVQEVLHNPSYKERAQLFSSIQRDYPMTPLERAVYWIEHVMKFGDAHLRPRSADMGVIELYQIDVIVFLFCVSLSILYIDYLIVRKCYKICCGKRRPKSKSD